MERTTTFGLGALVLSLLTTAGGALLVQHARAMPAPIEPARRELAGTVVEIVHEVCGYQNRQRPCSRPVVAYTDNGEQKQIVSRTAYSPSSPLAKGDSTAVFVTTDGDAWIASEWQARQADRQRAYESARRNPLWMGWIIVGCGAFGLLLGAGLIFFVDRSGATSPPPPSRA